VDANRSDFLLQKDPLLTDPAHYREVSSWLRGLLQETHATQVLAESARHLLLSFAKASVERSLLRISPDDLRQATAAMALAYPVDDDWAWETFAPLITRAMVLLQLSPSDLLGYEPLRRLNPDALLALGRVLEDPRDIAEFGWKEIETQGVIRFNHSPFRPQHFTAEQIAELLRRRDAE
jgi:hypothetical protein